MNIEQLRAKHGKNFFPVIKAELIKLGQEKPDFVYNTFGYRVACNYNGPAREEGKIGPECSGCIIGQALQRLGWDSAEELCSGIGIQILISDCPDDIGDVQGLQDSGASWGEAIKRLADASQQSVSA